MKNIYYVYSVGIRCQYEGDGWNELILDNENLISNAKSVLIEAVNYELAMHTFLLDDADKDFKSGKWSKDIYEAVVEEHTLMMSKAQSLLERIGSVSTVEDLESLSGEEVNGHEHIVIFKEAVLS